MMKIVLTGNPNVGKSLVLNQLTGSQLFASNYPGTSTEIAQAKMRLGDVEITFYDTPGVYSIHTDSEAASITRRLLENEKIDLLVHVIDAANLERNLVLSYELLNLGYPLLIVLNQIDRAREMGIAIDVSLLAQILNCPVISFSAARKEGMDAFRSFLEDFIAAGQPVCRTIDGTNPQRIILNAACSCSGNCSSCAISVEDSTTDQDLHHAEQARATAAKVSVNRGGRAGKYLDFIQSFMDRPILGSLTLLLLAYLGLLALTKFISLSEGPISGLLQPLSQILHDIILAVLPDGFFTDVLSKAIPEGLVIPFTIIMPAMLLVSLFMALLEDTGLLPRYSVALERAGRLFGVSGQAVIPLSLGFGCRTPAVMATRILPNDTQRFIVTTLLSIVVPCAATVGVLVMISAKFHASLAVILLSMFAVMMVLGLGLRRFSPHEEAFIYELPPLRIPQPGNVWTKIKLRFSGFFTEVLPLLLVMSIGIRALIESNLLAVFQGMDGFTRFLFGIPAEAFVAVLITVFQRYLAPLVLVNLALTPREATISLAMIALSLPCLPVMVVTVKELGWKSLIKILMMGLAVSAMVGVILNLLLPV